MWLVIAVDVLSALPKLFFFSSRRRHTRSVSAFLLNRSSDLHAYSIVIGGIQGDVLATDNNTVGMGDAGIKSAIQGSRSEERRVGKECRDWSASPSSKKSRSVDGTFSALA